MHVTIFDDTAPLDRLPRFDDMTAFKASRLEREVGRIVDYGSWTSNGVSFSLAFSRLTDELVAIRNLDNRVILLCRGITESVVGADISEAADEVLARGEGLDDLDWLVTWEHLGQGLDLDGVPGTASRRLGGVPLSKFRMPSQLLYG